MMFGLTGFSAHYFWYQVGSTAYLNSFFSTITYHLEPNGRGSRYPNLNKLYNGKSLNQDISELINEVTEIRTLLKEYKPNQAIWDYDDLTKKRPDGLKEDSSSTDLSNSFITSEGEDVFDLLLNSAYTAMQNNFDLEITTL